jgi:hypothetical protein
MVSNTSSGKYLMQAICGDLGEFTFPLACRGLSVPCSVEGRQIAEVRCTWTRTHSEPGMMPALSGMAATSVVHPSTLCVLCVSHRHASICSLQISLSAIEITLTVPLDHASWHFDTHFARRAAGPPRLPKQSPSHIGISAPGSRIPPHLSPTTQWPGHKVPESQRQWWHHIYTPPDLRPTVRLIG